MVRHDGLSWPDYLVSERNMFYEKLDKFIQLLLIKERNPFAYIDNADRLIDEINEAGLAGYLDEILDENISREWSVLSDIEEMKEEAV